MQIPEGIGIWQPAAEGRVFLKKLLVTLITSLSILFSICPAYGEGLDKAVSYGMENLDSGIITLSFDAICEGKHKVLVEKGGKRITYNLRNDGIVEAFPLQMGDGEYSISVLENIREDKYKYISTKSVNLDLDDDRQVYLTSVQNIRWNDDMPAIKKAAELAEGLKTDKQKIEAIHNYLISNIEYDHSKLSKLTYDYLPDVNATVASGKGICYDYASTFAAMLRSLGIPAKLVKGYSDKTDGYHAWNEVYNSETGSWDTIDSTYDAQMKSAGRNYSMLKDAKGYTKVYEY